MILVAGAVLLVRLVLALLVPVPVGVDLADAFWGWNLDLRSIALLGWLETVVIVFLGYKWIKSGWMALVLAVNPWLAGLTLHHPREALAVIGVGIILAFPKKAAVALGVGLILLTLWWGKPYWTRLLDNNILNQLRASQLAQEVDLIQKINFLATSKTYILPAMVRKIVYNKPSLAIEKVLTKTVSLADFEQISAPMSAWVLTGMSGIPPKGVTALFYFWEVAIIVWAIVKTTRIEKKYIFLFILLLLPAVIMEKKFFFVSGMGLLLLTAGIAAKGLENIQVKAVKTFFVILYLVGNLYMLHYMYFRQDSYRYSDAKLYYEAAKIITADTSQKYVVTDRFGPMKKMLTWYKVPLDQVDVRGFTLSKEGVSDTIYIGLPKEMQGVDEKKVIIKIEADDQLVYGFGSGLWVGKL